MSGAGRLAWNAHTALSSWVFSPFSLVVLAGLVAAASWYLQAEWALCASGKRWPGARTASFLAGLVAVDLALQSPVATFSMWYFQAHVVQHLLLMVVAPPLLAIGAPLTLFLEESKKSDRIAALAAVNSKPFQFLTHPVPVWFLYYFSMFAFFLTSALNYAMLHIWVMDVVNLAFLFTAAFFWWPLVGTDPVPHSNMSHGAKLTNLLIGIPVESFLALALISDPRPAASMYTMNSTRAGAAVLWIGAELLNLVSMVPVTVQWWRSGARQKRRYDIRYGIGIATAASLSSPSPEI